MWRSVVRWMLSARFSSKPRSKRASLSALRVAVVFSDNFELEPTRLLDANQIIVEHRFFDDSRPSPADWTKLTIAQQAADDHRTVVALAQIYTGAWVNTGISKGGMTCGSVFKPLGEQWFERGLRQLGLDNTH